MNKIDILRKYISSDDFYDLNGTKMLTKILKAMEEYAQQQVKLFAISDVSNSDDYYAHIEDALYSTNAFTTEESTNLANGIVQYLKDAGFNIVKI